MEKRHREFVKDMVSKIMSKEKMNKRTVEKHASSFDISDPNVVKELTELSIVKVAGYLGREKGKDIKDKFAKIVDLYENQVNLSHRTSQSILLQQYSTPAPIGFLAGIFCELDKLHINGGYAFEPSAGNGLLTIAGNPDRIYVNEIDPVRNSNLKTLGFANVWDRDASKPFIDVKQTFVAVVSNPPFGALDEPISFGNVKIKTLDHLMALRALETMTNDGKAAIIIGGHTEWDNKNRVQAGKNRIFLNYLYHHYKVVDVINIDGKKLYTRQGTGFNVRLLLIDGRKADPSGNVPLKSSSDNVVRTFEELFDRVMKHRKTDIRETELEAQALALELELLELDGLGAPYIPSSEACLTLDTVVPDTMDYEIHSALERVRRAVGGSIDDYVTKKLGYKDRKELCNSLSAEQTDAVALAIYNIEEKEQGMIIGDQTGIGKGRIAAAMIRYAVQNGHKPIFLTEKPNLFSDIYRDLEAIGSAKLFPFIVNSKESKTAIKDNNGTVVYQAPPKTEQDRAFKNLQVPGSYDFVVATYSQFNSPESKPTKPYFLRAIAEGNIIVMDESHNASGSSNTGEFLRGVLKVTKGVVFLSATFAKRPDNMPIYAQKTAMSEANMTNEELIEAITKGGVALQEILSSQLVAEGQMIRRERSFEGIEVNYLTLEDKEQEHSAIADNITAVLRDIISFQKEYIKPEIEELDKIAAAEGEEVELRQGTSQAGVTNTPYFSKIFNVINQMLFSVKAEEVANRAITRLKEGKKPIIAFASTMGSFIEQMGNSGDIINSDFSEVLLKGLNGVMRYTVIDASGERKHKEFNILEFSPEAQQVYNSISNRIGQIATGITISPIDVIIQIIEKAGYSVAEVTGRKYELRFNRKTGMGLIQNRKKINTNDAFREFNNNEVDVLMINQSGSTGASAHAIVTNKVPRSQVKQRVMIVLQPELDINTEVQKRGRINRTGQILPPIYDYVNSAIPAEKRLTMMLQKKLKSLDANTSSNQKQSDKIMNVEDFLNKYGDKVVKEYLEENPEINEILDDPLKSSEEAIEGLAHKVSGRVAVLSTKMQARFYQDISDMYSDLVEYLQQSGEYDLEVEAMDLEAETIGTEIKKIGKGGDSAFGDNTILTKVEANVLKRPFDKKELDNLIADSLKGENPITQKERILFEYNEFVGDSLSTEKKEILKKYEKLLSDASNDKKINKITNAQDRQEAFAEKRAALVEAQNIALDRLEKGYTNRKNYMEGILNFFHVGLGINYPEGSYQNGQVLTKAVFLGFQIDKSKKNPYAPSAVKCRFALASGNKYLAIPASYGKELQAIKGASYGMSYNERNVLENWAELIGNNDKKQRSIRYIVKGNILQAFSDFSGKLISYTTKGGTIEKGILLPEHYEPKESASIIVPIGRTKKILKTMTIGQSFSTAENFGINKQNYGYKLIVPASRKTGGKFYLDNEILALVENGNFHKVSNMMVASMPEENFNALIDILQSKFSQSVTISKEQFKMIEDDIPQRKEKERIVLPERPQMSDKTVNHGNNDLLLLELEAEALALELELLTI